MLFRSGVYRSICSLVLVLALSAVAFADTIRLKDGSIIKGKIVGFNGGRFTVAIGDGSRRREMTFSAAEIESIQFDSPQAQPANIKVSERTPPVTTTRKEPVIQQPAIKEPIQEPEMVDDSEDEVISVDSETASKTPPKVSVPDPGPPRANTPPPVAKTDPPRTNAPAASSTVSKSKPVELGVRVLADNTANGWTNSGWVVKKGQRIRITGEGRVSLGGGKFATPSGDPDIADEGKLLKSVATGALIAVIGDDNNEFIYVGAEREFTAARDGALFLGVNEGNLNDNSGSFDVKIEIMP